MAKQIYYMQNLDCPDCARKFLAAARALPGVVGAELNFAAAKLVVSGHVDWQQLQKAAARFDVALSRNNPAGGEKSKGRRLLILGLISAGLLLTELIISLFGWNLRLLLPVAVVVGGWPNFLRAGRNLRRFTFDTSVLMSVAVLGALALGEWREAALVAFLFILSDLLEAYTSGRARRSLATLLTGAPEKALRIRGDDQEEILAREVEPGDILLVRAGEKIPVDGLVIRGQSYLDQAAITGEAFPVAAGPGTTVYSGSINQMGTLTLRAEKRASDSTMAQIIRLVEEAQGKRLSFQGTVDRFAAVYTPVIIALALIISLGPPLFTGDWHAWLYRGLTLLVIACPCALALTTPAVLVTALGRAARQGILIKGGAWLERLAAVDTAAFDKTGTLTLGQPQLTAIKTYQISEEKALTYAAALESPSAHPLARILRKTARERNLSLPRVEGWKTVPGQGVQGIIDGEECYIGKLRENPTDPARELSVDESPAQNRKYDPNSTLNPQHSTLGLQESPLEAWQNQGQTIAALYIGRDLAAILAFADQPRPEAASMIGRLQQLGIKRTLILSGDNPGAVADLAQTIGVQENYGNLLPQEKVARLEAIKASGATVMMAGDGINDAPALATADVGIAMGAAGSASALEVADIALLGDDLSKIPAAVALAKRALRLIKQNIAIAIGLKCLVLLAVFPGWLTLWLAIISDMGANIIVSLNGIRLAWERQLTIDD
ncbi:MAG: cation-translocating P-type ATPase [Clostridiales bacterium]|nr:cation-translocating P-type ATPase [Clostridiales bacterium]